MVAYIFDFSLFNIAYAIFGEIQLKFRHGQWKAQEQGYGAIYW